MVPPPFHAFPSIFFAELVRCYTAYDLVLVYTDFVAVVEYHLNAFCSLLMAIELNLPDMSGIQRTVK